ncbi:protein SPEAR3 [Mercurialis annua]|uniref:protein SPEAR3 n=1 Tax=Mercurialis annua TaxID=3986 RepID=UPI00215EB0A4|nr:protein SPEAR3 [Mercurialis annua]
MSSSYYGEANDQRGGSSSTASRKGKKNSSENKPKQPQRGLGVAQLEKIRLHGQIGPSIHAPNYPSNFNQEDLRTQTAYSSVPSSVSYGFHPNIMMGIGHDFERTNIRYGDSHSHSQPSSTAASWNIHGNSFLQPQHFGQPSVARPLLHVEDTLPKMNKKHRSNSMGSSSQNSESSDSQELDLELRLSI